jgi:hypothetical protein
MNQMTSTKIALILRPEEVLILPIPETEEESGNFTVDLTCNETGDYLFTSFGVKEFDQVALIKLRDYLNELIELNKETE